MTFLGMSQTMGWLLAGTIATAIIIIFFLRIQHRRALVSSSILWERVLERRRRRSLLELLRRLLSLLIALGIGLSLAMALGELELGRAGREPRDVRLVVDNRPTMAAAMSDGRSRLEHALERAGELLAGGSSADRYTVYDATGGVVAAATRDRDAVRDSLAEIQPVARDLRLPLVEADSEVWLLTDGVGAGEVPPDVKVVAIYEPAVNAGVTAFEIRAQPTNRYRYEAFLEVGNFSPGPQTVRITLRDAAGVQFRRDVELAADGLYRNTFDLSPLGGGPVEAAVSLDGDAYALDDVAHVWLPRTRPVSLAYVSESPALLELLRSVPNLDLQITTPAEYAAASPEGIDAFLFEGWAPAAAPSRPAVLFGPPPVDWLPVQTGSVDEPGPFPFDVTAPLFRYADLHDVALTRALVYEPGGASVLAGTAELPIVLTGSRPVRWLLFAFELADSDLLQAMAMPILASNLVEWLRDEVPARRVPLGTVAVDLPSARVRDLTSGDAVVARSVAGRTYFEATSPGLFMASNDAGRVPYAARLDGREHSMVNASVFDAPDVEIDTPPAARSIWPTLLAVAAVLLALEGITYHRRITV